MSTTQPIPAVATYYPEMGHPRPAGALFEMEIGSAGYHVKWLASREKEAWVFFRANRIRPCRLSRFNSAATGEAKVSGTVTRAAGEKIGRSGISVFNAYL